MQTKSLCSPSTGLGWEKMQKIVQGGCKKIKTGNTEVEGASAAPEKYCLLSILLTFSCSMLSVFVSEDIHFTALAWWKSLKATYFAKASFSSSRAGHVTSDKRDATGQETLFGQTSMCMNIKFLLHKHGLGKSYIINKDETNRMFRCCIQSHRMWSSSSLDRFNCAKEAFMLSSAATRLNRQEEKKKTKTKNQN